jgi:hypothetical protein
MFSPSAVGTSEIPLTIHHGPVMHQMRAARVRMAARVGLLAPGMSPSIPTYNSVPAAQALSYPTTTRALAAHTRLVARPPHAVARDGEKMGRRDRMPQPG